MQAFEAHKCLLENFAFAQPTYPQWQVEQPSPIERRKLKPVRSAQPIFFALHLCTAIELS